MATVRIDTAAYRASVRENVQKILAREMILQTRDVQRLLSDQTYPPASEEGEPPAYRTGQLVQSISWRVRDEGKFMIAQIGSSSPYGVHLEFGTRTMGARPFMRPTFDARKPHVQKNLTAAMKGAA